MQLSAVGALLGFAAGMFVVYLILRIFLPTDIDTKREKWVRGSACVLAAVLFTFLGGFLFRTRLIQGDYAAEQCDKEGCDQSPIWEFRYELMTLYYCDDHLYETYEITDPKRYEMESVRDYAGNGVRDAWETALEIAREKMELPSDAEFCDLSEGKVTLRASQWTVRGSVTVYDEQGKGNRVFFTAAFNFAGSDYLLVDFSVD